MLRSWRWLYPKTYVVLAIATPRVVLAIATLCGPGNCNP